MNFQEYQREGFVRYEAFALTVRTILLKALEANTGIPRPQSLQHRAKSPDSLRDRLDEADKRESDAIERERRDLAGVRMIFYTNSDVERFLSARLISENFEIERESTRVHHPTKENEDRRYRAIHYTVCLRDDRAKLPEYSIFRGMRCEIQIQTILNHAWSETSHDILYKNEPREGFGSKAMESIGKRLNRIMDKYLLPAGYEFQRVQSDYQRLQQGKSLFDQDILAAIGKASDNNQRYELLMALKEDVLPNYDDVPGVFDDLIEPLIAAVLAARETPVKAIQTTFGDIEGKTAADVTDTVIEIFDRLRYLDVKKTFDIFRRLYVQEIDERVSKRIVEAVQRLANYDLQAWNEVGTGIQSVLADHVEALSLPERDKVRPLVTAVWRELLISEISGTRWHANSVTMSSASPPVSPQLKAIRGKAITALFDLFRSADNESERRQINYALDQATRISARGVYSNELLALTISDAIRIVNFFTDSAESLSYELRETLEDQFLIDYHHARDLADNASDPLGCSELARHRAEAILRFRDAINADPLYVRYKTLVGFRTVLPEHWHSRDRDFEAVGRFRTAEIKRLITEIEPANEAEWFAFVERCALTQSSDLATFPVFAQFLTGLATAKPETADRLLSSATENLMRFLAAILSGLWQSDAKDIYERRIGEYLKNGRYLASLARHIRWEKTGQSDVACAVLDRAIALEDDWAVVQLLLFALEANPGDGVPSNRTFFRPALQYLIRKTDTRWASEAWFVGQSTPFFESMAPEDMALLLEGLLDVPKIDYPAEQILRRIARYSPESVWDFFGRRLDQAGEFQEIFEFEVIPYSLHGLEAELSKNTSLAVAKVRSFFDERSSLLFRYRGGKLFSVVFPAFPTEVAQELEKLVTDGTGVDADFVISILENYRGAEATHEVLKAVVVRYPDDKSRLSQVSASFDGTGVVHGEFGWVDALREKRDSLKSWLVDERPAVRQFAESHIRELELDIADGQRRAEQDVALRKLDYDSDDEANGDAD